MTPKGNLEYFSLVMENPRMTDFICSREKRNGVVITFVCYKEKIPSAQSDYRIKPACHLSTF